jgi:NADPH-dependent 2,4-dienoyl-CoA reductase/sulfur reductase-like enzyme
VAGGASCAARLRRLDEKVDILMVERGPYVSYANCGLPYHVSGVIPKESSLLVANEKLFREQFRMDVRTNCEAIAISPRNKTVDLKNVETGAVTSESYDKLVLSPAQLRFARRFPESICRESFRCERCRTRGRFASGSRLSPATGHGRYMLCT